MSCLVGEHFDHYCVINRINPTKRIRYYHASYFTTFRFIFYFLENESKKKPANNSLIKGKQKKNWIISNKMDKKRKCIDLFWMRF
jgi:hypothetical protein